MTLTAQEKIEHQILTAAGDSQLGQIAHKTRGSGRSCSVKVKGKELVPTTSTHREELETANSCDSVIGLLKDRNLLEKTGTSAPGYTVYEVTLKGYAHPDGLNATMPG